MSDCQYCHHSIEAYHCKGNVKHTHYKDEMKQAGGKGIIMRVSICKVRHCSQPLCDCTNVVTGETREAICISPQKKIATLRRNVKSEL